MEPILDCTALNPSQRKRQFDARLKALEEGGGFILHSTVDLADLLALMDHDYPGMFEYHRISDSPGDSAVLVARRRTGRAPGGIVAWLLDDHRLIDSLVRRLGDAARQGEIRRVVLLAHQLQRLLAAHFRREEELFFPALLQRLGGAGHLVRRLREEHQQGLELVRLIGRTLATVDENVDVEHLRRRADVLHGLLQTHSRFEDGLFYLLAEVLLNDVEQRELLERFRAGAAAASPL